MLRLLGQARITTRILGRFAREVGVTLRRKRVLFVSWTDCQVRRRESNRVLLRREGD